MSKPNDLDYLSGNHKIREYYWRFWCHHHSRSASRWRIRFFFTVTIAVIAAVCYVILGGTQ